MEFVIVIDGKERPGWWIRAGQRIIATEYNHGAQRMVLTLEQPDDVAACDPAETLRMPSTGIR